MGVLRALFSVVAMVALIMSMAAAQYQTPTLPSHSPGSSHSAPDGGYYLLGVEQSEGRQLQSVRGGRPSYKKPTRPGHSPGSPHGPPNPPVPTPLLDYSGGASGDNGGAGGGDDDAVKDGGTDDEMKS